MTQYTGAGTHNSCFPPDESFWGCRTLAFSIVRTHNAQPGRPALDIRVSFLGYHRFTVQEVRSLIEAGDFQALTGGPGGYLVIAERGRETWLVASTNWIRPYFYAVSDGGIAHADNVLEVLRQAGLEWRWNWSAL